MTYRARIEGTFQTDSDSLVALIQEWVDGGPGIIVTGVLLTADSECVVAVSSLNEGECSKEDPPPPSTSDNTAGIIGGVVAVVIILIIAIAVVITAILVLKYRRGNISVKTTEM